MANAIVRQASNLSHFTPEQIIDPSVQSMIPRITCIGDPKLDGRGHSAVDVTVTTTDGEVHRRQLDVPPGFPGNPLTAEEHLNRFRQCMEYSVYPLPPRQVDAFLAAAANLDALPDARRLIQDLIVPDARARNAA